MVRQVDPLNVFWELSEWKKIMKILCIVDIQDDKIEKNFSEPCY